MAAKKYKRGDFQSSGRNSFIFKKNLDLGKGILIGLIMLSIFLSSSFIFLSDFKGKELGEYKNNYWQYWNDKLYFYSGLLTGKVVGVPVGEVGNDFVLKKNDSTLIENNEENVGIVKEEVVPEIRSEGLGLQGRSEGGLGIQSAGTADDLSQFSDNFNSGINVSFYYNSTSGVNISADNGKIRMETNVVNTRVNSYLATNLNLSLASFNLSVVVNLTNTSTTLVGASHALGALYLINKSNSSLTVTCGLLVNGTRTYYLNYNTGLGGTNSRIDVVSNGLGSLKISYSNQSGFINCSFIAANSVSAGSYKNLSNDFGLGLKGEMSITGTGSPSGKLNVTFDNLNYSLGIASSTTIYPSLNFTSPTSGNGTSTTNTFVEVNVSIAQGTNSLSEIKYNWNGTNYTMYNDSLMLLMNFDNLSAFGENSTSNFTADVSKYAINGTCSGMGAGCNYTTGKYGVGIGFSNASVNTNQKFTSQNGITAMAWIKPNFDYNIANTNFPTVVGNFNDAGTIGWSLYYSPYSDSWIFACGNYTTYGIAYETAYTSNTQLVKGSWTHLAGYCNLTETALFKNGILVNKSFLNINNISTPAGNLHIGRNIGFTSATSYFVGEIDEVRIWNRSLSAAEVYQQYASNLNKYNSTQWYLYVNQSKNATTGLDLGTYTYYAAAKDSSGNENSTETRYITIQASTIYPSLNFTFPTPTNGTSTFNNSVAVNVSIAQGTYSINEIKYNWNGTNYSMYNDSLVLMYNLENLSALGENDTKVIDVSKYGKNGTVNGSTWTASGKYGGAYNFNGLNNSISLGLTASQQITNTNNITVMMWIKPRSSCTSSDLICGLIGSQGGSQGYHFHLFWNGRVVIYLYGPSVSVQSDYNYSTHLNEWIQVAFTYDGKGTDAIKLYVNGVVEKTGTGTALIPTSTDIRLGQTYNNIRFFNGSIDEVRIWNRSLSAAEVYQQYASNLNKYNSTQWYLYVNQSKNATTGLDVGTYTYYAAAKDSSGNENSTETRYITLQSFLNPSLNFTFPTPTNGTSTFNNSIAVNVSIAQGTYSLNEIKYNWNGTNYTFYNDSLLLMMNFNNLSAFSESSTSNFTADLSKYNNSGNCSGMGDGCNWTTGKYGRGLTFDGINDFVNVPHSTSLNVGNKVTYEAWIYPTSFTDHSYHTVVAKAYASAFWFGLYANTGKIQLWAGGTAFSSTGAVSLNQWSHIVITWNGTTIVYYINGVQDNTSAQSSPAVTNTVAMYIGADREGATNPAYLFTGKIDEVRIYNRTLSAQEVYQQYASNLNKYNSTQWSLYVNQSKSATTGLDVGTYTYSAAAKDSSGNENSTETRYLDIIITPPVITSPVNASPITTSAPSLIWSNSNGGGTKTYELILDDTIDFSSPLVNTTINEAVGSTSYTLTTDLVLDTTYYWKVRAYDGTSYSSWSTAQFDLLSSVALSLPRNSVDFGNMTANQQKDTTQAGLSPLVISNDGNVPVNIFLNATALFSSINSDVPGLYQFNVTENETSAYVSAAFSAWMDLNSTEMQAINSLKQENTTNTANRANLHIKIRIPSDQAAGYNSSTIFIRAAASG